jgi:integrase
LKDLRKRYAASTINGILTVFSMMLDDAVDQRLIPVNAAHRRRRRGRRRDHAPSRVEKVFAMPEHILRIADQASMLGGPSAGLLVITAAWTGCRWGELAGLQRDHIDLLRRVIVIDPEHGALHESAHGLWLGPPKTPASARTITLPPFLTELLREHLATTPDSFVFTSPLGCRLRRSTFDRRVFRPAVDGNARKGTQPVRPGLTFHGLRHSHKTWLIADNRPRRKPAGRAPHTAPALRTIPRRGRKGIRPQLTTTRTNTMTRNQEAINLPNFSTSVHAGDQHPHRITIIDRTKKALRPGKTPDQRAQIRKWS